MIALASQPMTPPKLLKEFQEDFETVRSARVVAVSYLKFDDDHRVAADGMKRTFKAAVDVGQALCRMHDTESYRDNYASWKDLCRALRLPRNGSYRLMNVAKGAHGTERIAGEMTAERAEVLGRVTPEEKEEVIDEAEAGDADEAFERIRAKLRARAPGPRVELIAPPKGRDWAAFWASRQVEDMRTWFHDRGLLEQAAPLIDALMQLAKG